MSKKGFTLLELILVVLVLSIAFILAIPVITKIIEYSKYNTFITGVKNTIDGIDLYIAKNDFITIPEEGLYITDLKKDVIKNNYYDSGVIVRRKEQTQVINLSQGKFCAKGTKMELITTDKGCGALDETKPTKVDIFLKNETEDYLYIVVGGYDSESEIIKYELSVDNKYIKNKDEKYNVFRVAKDGKKHYFKARITNEAGLSIESENKIFESENETILCTKEIDNNVSCNLENNKFSMVNSGIIKDPTNNYLFSTSENVNFVLKSNNTDIDINILSADSLLKNSVPVLEENMIPVIYTNNKWVIASRNTKYWDYENKIWANAVITRKNRDINDPNSKPREYYLSSDAIGEEINENDILGYYVWIPKFSYEVWNKAGLDIKKEDKGVTNINVTFDDSNIHSAFLYNNTNGFWVSKYEANINKDSNCILTPAIQYCNLDSHDILFKNSEFILKNISISNAYKSIVNFNGKIGITNTHLLTNLEWGAIAYLSHSKYGIGTNIKNETTTGNPTGVYNMGINKEFVMGNFNNDLGLDDKNNSGFSKMPEQYIDVYKSSTIKGRKLGDATGETENWYNSSNTFINGNSPFIVRGENSIFDFTNSTGYADSNTTFRMVISK